MVVPPFEVVARPDRADTAQTGCNWRAKHPHHRKATRTALIVQDSRYCMVPLPLWQPDRSNWQGRHLVSNDLSAWKNAAYRSRCQCPKPCWNRGVPCSGSRPSTLWRLGLRPESLGSQSETQRDRTYL